jgi:hypothetical protein
MGNALYQIDMSKFTVEARFFSQSRQSVTGMYVITGIPSPDLHYAFLKPPP